MKEGRGNNAGSRRVTVAPHRRVGVQRMWLPKTRPHGNGAADDLAEGGNTEEVSATGSSHSSKKRKQPLPSDHLVLLQALAKTAYTSDHPDKPFLLSLLLDFKSVSQSAKLDVKIEFMNFLKRLCNHLLESPKKGGLLWREN
ncbi:hypothetical protein O3P69_012825 [Scylla paramamosain]|uniref:BESS domain-containing protein n=1 Tax=Scylla paramamosain TaxID=85552 RepID=A0AAW0TUE8_SCYPA